MSICFLSSASDQGASDRYSRRSLLIVSGVVLLHAAGLWALQAGLVQRVAEVVIPADMLPRLIDPPEPREDPPPRPPPAPKALAPKAAPVRVPSPAQAPQPVAVAETNPSPNAPTGVSTPQPVAPALLAPVTPAAVAPAAPPAPQVELPLSDADYLQNPKPAYPAISKRLGEQGKVIVRVLIGLDGLPQKAEIKQSSHFDRLDQVALATVMRWRFVPGKRGGVPEAMWCQVPLNFVLE